MCEFALVLSLKKTTDPPAPGDGNRRAREESRLLEERKSGNPKFPKTRGTRRRRSGGKNAKRAGKANREPRRATAREQSATRDRQKRNAARQKSGLGAHPSQSRRRPAAAIQASTSGRGSVASAGRTKNVARAHKNRSSREARKYGAGGCAKWLLQTLGKTLYFCT